jgi:hypothetical protein
MAIWFCFITLDPTYSNADVNTTGQAISVVDIDLLAGLATGSGLGTALSPSSYLRRAGSHIRIFL